MSGIEGSMNGEAQYLLDNELLKEIFDQLERIAIETGINAKIGDDELRRLAASEVRAIRSVRLKLKSLLSDKTNQRTDTVA
jgi:hypothetical protein